MSNLEIEQAPQTSAQLRRSRRPAKRGPSEAVAVAAAEEATTTLLVADLPLNQRNWDGVLARAALAFSPFAFFRGATQD